MAEPLTKLRRRQIDAACLMAQGTLPALRALALHNKEPYQADNRALALEAHELITRLLNLLVPFTNPPEPSHRTPVIDSIAGHLATAKDGAPLVLIPEEAEGGDTFAIEAGWHAVPELLRAHAERPDAIIFIADMIEV